MQHTNDMEEGSGKIQCAVDGFVSFQRGASPYLRSQYDKHRSFAC